MILSLATLKFQLLHLIARYSPMYDIQSSSTKFAQNFHVSSCSEQVLMKDRNFS